MEENITETRQRLKQFKSVLAETRHGAVSEENLAYYVMGYSTGAGNAQALYSKIVQDGYARAAFKLSELDPEFNVDKRDASIGIKNVIMRTRMGYSEADLADFVMITGLHQELYDDVVKHGFIYAVRLLKEEEPELSMNRDCAVKGITRAFKRMGYRYYEEDLIDFAEFAGYPQEIFDEIARQPYVNAAMKILEENPTLKINAHAAYEGLENLRNNPKTKKDFLEGVVLREQYFDF